MPATRRLLDMIEQGMANTDARVAEDKPVTPAFLFAVLLWGEVREVALALIEDGMAPSIAWQRAAHRVVAAQAEHVAIPRRFTHMMEEIWTLQPRLTQRTRKRVFRLLEHPRFRAAYDFLLLRAGESEEIRELGQWWTSAQQTPEGELATQLGTTARSPAPARKRRRRRRGGRKTSGDSKAE